MTARPLRVLHVVGGLNIGGVETWLAQGTSRIDRSRYHFDFLVFNDGRHFYRPAIEACGARVFRIPPPRRLLSFARAFLKVLRENAYDAVHAHTWCSSAYVLALAAWAGVPRRVFHSHTAQDDSRAGWLRSLYFQFSRGMIQRYASRGVAVSREAASPFFPRDWESHPERWTIASPGIDLAPFAVSPERDSVRSEFRIQSAAKVIVHVGRFAPVKNHSFLLTIASAMAGIDGSVVFLLVGEGERRAAIAQTVEEMDLRSSVVFAGARTDVPRILKACDAFVLPSLYEGFPLAYIEAQAAGLPCVISDAIDPAADLVPERTFRLSTAQSAFQWANALWKALESDPSRTCVPELEDISIESSMERLMNCYR